MTVSPRSDNPTEPAPAWQPPAAYQQLHGDFVWRVPELFNMAGACCARWAALPDAAQRVAVRVYAADGAQVTHSYAELQAQANRLSNVLLGLGVARGDRVAIVLPQRFETAVAYMAVLQMGAVAMPLSQLFGPDALAFRLQDSQAVLAIGDEQTLPGLAEVRGVCPDLRNVIGVWAAQAPQHLADHDYDSALAHASDSFAAVRTRADDPAVLIYTSGTTGNPKGALIAQRALIGNLTGFLCSQNFFGFIKTQVPDQTNKAQAAHILMCAQAPQVAVLPTSDAVFWSPADWAWTGGLMDALLPTLYFGRCIVAYAGRFSAPTALALLRDCQVTHTFLFPTALKAIMKAYPAQAPSTLRARFGLVLQAIMSAGEAVGDAVFDYCQSQLGVTVNEMFGQTEINYIVGNCALLWPPKAGSMGLGYPGHRLAVIDDDGRECAPGVAGEVAVHRLDVHGQPDPIFFSGYWRNEATTRAKYTGDWCRTGDLAQRDLDGYLWYQGRSDDVFKVAGYRIGPGEIENCLVKHAAVANAAVVPKPDRERGAVVKAYVVLAPEFVTARASDTRAKGQFDVELVAQLQAHVKGLLAPYEYPKEIEFVDALPMTTTGKVQRRVLRLQEVERAKAAAATK